MSNLSTEGFGIDFGFFENAGGADYGVLGVGAGFAFKAKGFLEIEGDH